MADIHGLPGEWARVKGMVLGLWPLFIAFTVAGFSLAVWLLVAPGTGAILFALSLAAVYCLLLKGMRRVERFFKGARGEEKVSAALRNLPSGYHVFNDYVAEGKHIDHVVVGPSGVFSVETKCWAGELSIEEGQILINGRLPSRLPVPQALREAGYVKAALERLGWTGKVIPVLAFASDNFRSHALELNGTLVLNSSELTSTIASATAILPETEVRRLVGIME